MAEDGVTRRLAAILAADVAGYTRLMEADENATIAAWKAARTEVIDPKIAQYRGRIVKHTGDGFLAEFGSVTDAVNCAIDMQKLLAARADNTPEDRRMNFRMGVNLGDIVEELDDIHGDGVNIAARLEGLAEPGGICVSGSVYEQVRKRVDLDFEDLGSQKVKNIAEPIRAYRIRSDGEARAARTPTVYFGGNRWPAYAAAAVVIIAVAGGVAWWLKPWASDVEPASVEKMAFPLPDKPSIAVLPFDNLSGDPEQEYFADGITEDITTELSRFRGLFVIARKSAFVYKDKAVNMREVGRELGVRYVLEGSVRRSGTTVRINAQLVDAATGAHLWAERYDRDMRDVFAMQDEVTQKIVSAIGTTQLFEAATRRVSRKNPKDLDAYDLHLRAPDLFHRFTPEDNAEARALNMRAAALDPSYSRPHSGLAWTHLQEVFLGWSDRPAESLQSALVSAQRAVALDDSDSSAHWALGAVYLHMGQHDRALAAHERALTLNPNDADILAHYGGFVLVFAGRPEEGIEAVAKAKRLNPHYPWWYAFGLGRDYFDARRYDEAIEAWRDKTAPDAASQHVFIAAAHAQAGRLDEARAIMDKFPQAFHGVTVSHFAAGHPYKDPADLQHLLDGLRKAGVPE